jgi:hypothetical protein
MKIGRYLPDGTHTDNQATIINGKGGLDVFYDSNGAYAWQDGHKVYLTYRNTFRKGENK